MSLSSSKSRVSASGSRTKSRGGRRETQGELTFEDDVPQLAWQIVSQEKTSQLASLPVREVAKVLAEVLSLTSCEVDLKEAAILDYYVAGYWFAKENEFTNEQISAFITLLHSLLGNIQNKHFSLVDNVRGLQQHMMGVGVSERSSLQCFTEEKAQLMVEYIASSLFQHHHLFECLFSEEQELEQISCKVDVSLPPSVDSLQPAPLEEAVSESFYHRLIAPPPTPPTADGSDALNAETDTDVVNEVSESTSGPIASIKVTPEEVKSMMKNMTEKAFSSYQEELALKLKNREEMYSSKLSKIGNK